MEVRDKIALSFKEVEIKHKQVKAVYLNQKNLLILTNEIKNYDRSNNEWITIHGKIWSANIYVNNWLSDDDIVAGSSRLNGWLRCIPKLLKSLIS